MKPSRVAVPAYAGLLLSKALCAHDFWIEPSSFRPAVGSVVAARLMVGQKFRGEPLPRNPALIVKFVLVSDKGETPVSGRPAADPAGTVSISEPGLLVLGYRSANSPVSLEAAKFEEYLKEEGLEKILEARARRGESQTPSREVFSRCAKSLLSAGGGGKTGFDRDLGFSLELIPERNPYTLKAGEELPVRLLSEGKPLEGALVAALPNAAPEERLSQRTDRNGRVRLRLSRDGAWLVKAVHMIPAAAETGADWQSLWASLTFEIPAASPVGKAP
jgi:uncharacterized GH25 family protein